MGTKRFAICDKDQEYLRMLQAYLLKRNLADFTVLIFDTVNKALEANKEGPFEILLVGEDIYDTNVAKIDAAKIYILQEDGTKGITEYCTVAKYQSMERMIAQVLAEFALDDNCTATNRCSKNKTSLISFYAPDRQKGQSIAALCTAELLADQGNQVLYINLLPFAGFEELMQTNYESDITDFMYFVLNHSDKLSYKLDSLKRCIHGVDYLPPALDYADLLAISRDDWEQFLNLLLYSSDYDWIILDLSEVCQGFYDMLEKCETIYLLIDNTTIYAQAMLTHFKKLLQAKERSRIWEQIIEVTLPANWDKQCRSLEKLTSSPVGIRMKGVLDKRG